MYSQNDIGNTQNEYEKIKMDLMIQVGDPFIWGCKADNTGRLSWGCKRDIPGRQGHS